jgi:hypothetical protein
MCVLRFRPTSVVLGWWSEINVCFKVQTHISSVRLMVRSQCGTLKHTLTSDYQPNTTDVSLNLKTHIDF